MAQALEEGMHNYFIQLNNEEKRLVILMLKTFLQSRKENFEHISIEQYNNFIIKESVLIKSFGAIQLMDKL